MTKNPDEIICILDRSGSMDSIREDAIGGFNTVLFDDTYDVVHSSVPLQDVPALIDDVGEAYGWQFVFLAVNQDAVLTASHLNIAPEDALSFEATPDGVDHAMLSMKSFVSERRARQKI